MTDEQYNKLSEATPHYKTAKHGYIRNAPRWLSELVMTTFEEATGTRLPVHDLSCAVCVLRIYQIIGAEYDKETERRKKSEVTEIITKKLIEENAKNDIETVISKPNGRDKKENKGSSKKNSKRNK